MSQSATSMACNCRGGPTCCMRAFPGLPDPGQFATAPYRCPVCTGGGQVYDMTPAYRVMVEQAAGGSFGWAGQTHEWRSCHACGGSGLVWR